MDAKDEYTPPTIDELKVLFPEANLDEKEIMKASEEYTKKILESKDNIIVDEKPVATYFYEDGPHRIYLDVFADGRIATTEAIAENVYTILSGTSIRDTYYYTIWDPLPHWVSLLFTYYRDDSTQTAYITSFVQGGVGNAIMVGYGKLTNSKAYVKGNSYVTIGGEQIITGGMYMTVQVYYTLAPYKYTHYGLPY